MRYTNLEGKKWIGDLSLPDADVLVSLGSKAKRILEFGVGGSTHLLAQCKPDTLICLDTSGEWLEITKVKLAKITEKTQPTLVHYELLDEVLAFNEQPFQLIFVDGVDDLRIDFANRTWEHLAVGGVMVFHDTRRPQDMINALNTTMKYFTEVETVFLNANDSFGNSSNMTVLLKKVEQPYVNWNYEENKPLESYHAHLTSIEHPLWDYSLGKFDED